MTVKLGRLIGDTPGKGVSPYKGRYLGEVE